MEPVQGFERAICHSKTLDSSLRACAVSPRESER
jgi:hypothetical protein